VLHAATLHKPHVGWHTRQDFVDTNLTGTLDLLEEAAGGRGAADDDAELVSAEARLGPAGGGLPEGQQQAPSEDAHERVPAVGKAEGSSH